MLFGWCWKVLPLTTEFLLSFVHTTVVVLRLWLRCMHAVSWGMGQLKCQLIVYIWGSVFTFKFFFFFCLHFREEKDMALIYFLTSSQMLTETFLNSEEFFYIHICRYRKWSPPPIAEGPISEQLTYLLMQERSGSQFFYIYRIKNVHECLTGCST